MDSAFNKVVPRLGVWRAYKAQVGEAACMNDRVKTIHLPGRA